MNRREAIFSEKNNENVRRYYQDTYLDYFFLLRLWRHRGMHYGFYDDHHKKLEDAILNTNRVLAEKAEIHKGTRVLDSGCGIGGSSIWLAKNIGAEVVGITIVESQCKKAKELAKKHGVEDKTQFFVRDFRDTKFPDSTFDVVWAIESVCHAEDKREFITEAYRVLQPGGRFIIADGFQKKDALTPAEQNIMKKWLENWAVPNLAITKHFITSMQTIGFKKVEYENANQNITPFSRWLYRMAIMVYPMAKMLEWLQIRSKTETGNVVGAFWQYRCLKRGLWEYLIFRGEK